MKLIIFLLAMAHFVGIASASVTQDEGVFRDVGIETVQAGTMDVQASVCDVAFEPGQSDFASCLFEYGVMDVSQCIVEFNDMGLKPSETFIPTQKTTSLNYCTGKYNYLKHRFRCSDLRGISGLHT